MSKQLYIIASTEIKGTSFSVRMTVSETNDTIEEALADIKIYLLEALSNNLDIKYTLTYDEPKDVPAPNEPKEE